MSALVKCHDCGRCLACRRRLAGDDVAVSILARLVLAIEAVAIVALGLALAVKECLS